MSTAGHRRLRLHIEGLVQGVGFRPFVHQLATALELAGWVENTAAGVCLELEGPTAALEAFLARLPRERPPHCRLDRLQQQWLPPQASAGFRILTTAPQSAPGCPPAAATALQLPDLAPCAACLAELSDPASRRCGYAFTSCTHCGPRFSIQRALPFERCHTALASFHLCAGSLTPIPKASPFVRSPYSGAYYKPEFKGSVCTIDGMAQVGVETLGLVCLLKK